MIIVLGIFMFIFGACIGSFLCCQARRLHRKDEGKKSLGPRSVCLHCGKKLTFRENLPLISWLAQKGKCTKCGHKIGAAEFISELLTALTFVAIWIKFVAVFHLPVLSDLSLTTISPLSWALLVTELVFVSTLIFLAIYDGLFGLLPLKIILLALFLSVTKIILSCFENIPSSFDNMTLSSDYVMSSFSAAATNGFSPEIIVNALLSALILGGLYLALYLISRGKWVGDGDWLLALAIGLAIGRPFYALLALIVANFSACLIMYPSVKKTRDHQIYFGPFLVLSYVIIILCIS